MDKLIKECLPILLIPIIILGAGIYGIYHFYTQAQDTQNAVIDKQQDVATKQQMVEKLRAEKLFMKY